MTKFITYQTFSDLNEASDLIELLNANQIPFEIDDSALHFDVVPQNINPMDNGVMIKIKPMDKERVDNFFITDIEKESFGNHYLFSFSDNDIIDIIVNPEEWPEEEIALAKKISKQRDLKPTAEQVKKIRKNTGKATEQIKKENSVSGGAAWFSIISFYSITTTIMVIFSPSKYIQGLGINRVIMDIVYSVYKITGNNYFELGISLTFILPLFFFWISSKCKKKNKKAYLTGMIVLGVDTLLLVLLYQSWFSIAFQLLGLGIIFTGYKTLIANKKASGLVLREDNEIITE